MELDDKQSWKAFRKMVYRNLLYDGMYPVENKKRIQSPANIYGLYETPKTYVGGVAYNDGSWLKYSTCRITNDRFRCKVLCRTKKVLIDYVYGYMCFLRKVGIVERDEMVYYSICFIIFKLTYRKGLFNASQDHKQKVIDLAESVLKSKDEDIRTWRPDRRKFCMDPRVKKDMTKAEKTSLQKKVQGQMKDDLIRKWYNPKLSVRKNVEEMKRQGVKDISKSSLDRWIQKYIRQEEVSHMDFQCKNQQNR